MGLNKENEIKLNSAIRLVTAACATGQDTLGLFPTGSYGDDGFIFLSFMERFTFHLEGVKTLLGELNIKPFLDASIGVIIRVCLLDFMTITYLTSYAFDDGESRKAKKPDRQMQKQVEMLMCDQIHNTLRYLKSGMESKMITRKEYGIAIRTTWTSYSKFFKDDKVDFSEPENKLIHKEFVTPRKMFDRINSHKAVKKFALVYDLYNYYSKYEHIGVLSHALQRLDADEQFLSILTGVKYSLKGLQAAMSWADGLGGSLKKELDRLSEIDDELSAL